MQFVEDYLLTMNENNSTLNTVRTQQYLSHTPGMKYCTLGTIINNSNQNSTSKTHEHHILMLSKLQYYLNSKFIDKNVAELVDFVKDLYIFGNKKYPLVDYINIEGAEVLGYISNLTEVVDIWTKNTFNAADVKITNVNILSSFIRNLEFIE